MMLSLPKRKSQYAPAELGEAHREIIRMHTLGAAIHEIAEEMGCSRHHVRYVLNSPLAMEMRKELQQRRDDECVDVTARLAKLCPKAMDVMEGVLDGEVEGASLSLRVRVCESILDRAGFGKITKTQNQNLNASLTAEDILNLQRRAETEARAVGILA